MQNYIPEADEWLNDEQLAEVRRQVGETGPLVMIDSIFTRFDLEG